VLLDEIKANKDKEKKTIDSILWDYARVDDIKLILELYNNSNDKNRRIIIMTIKDRISKNFKISIDILNNFIKK